MTGQDAGTTLMMDLTTADPSAVSSTSSAPSPSPAPTTLGQPSTPDRPPKPAPTERKSKRGTSMKIQSDTISAAKALNPVRTSQKKQMKKKPVSFAQLARSIHELAAMADEKSSPKQLVNHVFPKLPVYNSVDPSQAPSLIMGPDIVPNGTLQCCSKSPRKRLSDHFDQDPMWNPRDPTQMQAVKEALHVAKSPHNVVCREEEQKKILDFCKLRIQQHKGGSLYACGCPGTGKTLSIEKVKELLVVWSKEVGYQLPDTLTINCTSLTNTREIFSKILEKVIPQKKITVSFTPLQHLQSYFSQKGQPSPGRMILVIVDEMDYLITKDRAVLHDLFMLTTLPFSRCILIGIANAIDLADRFLPKLESLNCKPIIVNFRAYSKDQILQIIQQRLMVIGCDVFQSSALEFCARKVAAASGDMRRALDVCMSAIEVLEAELKDSTTKQEANTVGFDHMGIALSKAFKSPVVDTLQSLPQHQQIILCSVVKLFRQCKKKATTLGELNRSYSELCKSSQIPAVGTLDFTNICKVLSDQGIIKLGQSKEDKLKRVTLQVDNTDITFAFKGIRFFDKCLEK